MDIPENLMDAVNRLKPQMVLFLDTNVIMNSPRLDRRDKWEINAPGPHLLVIPRIVDIELMSLTRGGKDEDTREKASRACYVTDKLFERGNPTIGIDLGADRWLISVDVPSGPDTTTLEDDLARKILSKVDAALVKLVRACVQGCSDTSVLLVTEDRNCRRFARNGGLSSCRRSDLRSSESLEEMVLDRDPRNALDIEADVAATVNSDEERHVEIAITLEELRSEGDDLVARGSGGLTYDGKRFPFRWTFPYHNLAIYNWLEDDVPIDADTAVMPLENIDFMGADNEIPEDVRRFVCRMLEDAYESKDLQSPVTKVRASMLFNSHMGITRGGAPFDYPLSDKQKKGKKEEDVSRYEELRLSHNQHVKSLYDGSAKSMSEAYRSAFQLSEAIDSFWDGFIDDDYDGDNWNVELSLMEFLDVALEAWVVGETREAEFMYRPFAWPEEQEESIEDDEEEVVEDTE